MTGGGSNAAITLRIRPLRVRSYPAPTGDLRLVTENTRRSLRARSACRVGLGIDLGRRLGCLGETRVERDLDPPPRDLVPVHDALGVDLQEHLHAVACPRGDLRRVHSGV